MKTKRLEKLLGAGRAAQRSLHRRHDQLSRGRPNPKLMDCVGGPEADWTQGVTQNGWSLLRRKLDGGELWMYGAQHWLQLALIRHLWHPWGVLALTLYCHRTVSDQWARLSNLPCSSAKLRSLRGSTFMRRWVGGMAGKMAADGGYLHLFGHLAHYAMSCWHFITKFAQKLHAVSWNRWRQVSSSRQSLGLLVQYWEVILGDLFSSDSTLHSHNCTESYVWEPGRSRACSFFMETTAVDSTRLENGPTVSNPSQ